jgi:polyhydroxyalkanoate synthesis regulator phasin
MVSKDDVQRYLDAGIAFTAVTRARAEELVGELVTSGTFQSTDARAKVDDLIERSRKSREALVAQIRSEVTSQLSSLGITSLDDLAREVADIVNRTAEAGRAAADKVPGTKSGSTAKKPPTRTSATPTATSSTTKPPKETPSGKTATAKTSTGKAAAKTATARTSTARAATSTTDKKTTGKKATGTKSTAKTASATTSTGTKSTPKATAARNGVGPGPDAVAPTTGSGG